MPAKVISSMENDYLLIKASGSISNMKDWKELPKQYYDEVMKYNVKKIVIDATELQYPEDILHQTILVDTYSAELPAEIKQFRIAVVVDPKQKESVDFWETYGYNRGYQYYKAFYSIDEARKFMND